MRTIAILTLLTLAFVGIALYVQGYLARTGESLIEEVRHVMESARETDWREAGKRADRLLDRWESTENRWSFLTEHQEIDDINGTLSRLRAYVAEEDRTSALAEAEAALQLFQHIPRKETLTFVNIF